MSPDADRREPPDPEPEPVVAVGAWSAVAATSVGGTHRRADRPNQDAHVAGVVGDALVVVVADGHGSETSFRSDRGSALATEAGLSLAEAIARATAGMADPARQLPDVLPTLVRAMVGRWQDAVRADEGRDRIRPGRRAWPAGATDADLLRAYGSTFLFAMLAPGYAAFVQIGDGDMSVRRVDGPTREAVPVDDRLFGNETTSLCDVDFARDVRYRVLDARPADVDLVLCSTDGYGNAFEDDRWQPEVADDVTELARAHGLDWVAENLGTWAEDAALTAGDDVTIVLAFHRRSLGEAGDA